LKLLFDAGRGATIRLRQINVSKGSLMSKIDALFLTHYHSDHTVGIPDLWLTGWLGTGGRKEPFRLIGPVGAKSLMANLESAYALDIKIRMEDEKLPAEGIATVVEEFEKDGIVYERDGVKVIAFTVDHGAAIKPAVGYRIEYKGRAVVIFGRHPLPSLRPARRRSPYYSPRSWRGIFFGQAEVGGLFAFSLSCLGQGSSGNRG
jgi:ribonuclease Z